MHLPDLPLQICTRGAPTDEPLIVVEGQGREQRVLAATPAARRAGVQPGVRASAAHALIDRLEVRGRDPGAEREALERLAALSGRYTSHVSLAPPASLLLEVGGSRNLFGGLEPLIARVAHDLAELGYGARCALAPTPLGATWLAASGVEARARDHGTLFEALAPLPLTCLGLDAKREALLHGMGLRHLADCLRLPRDGLARRLGPEVLLALDRAFGRLPDPRESYAPPAHFRARLPLPSPVATAEALLFPIHRLLLELAGFLEARALGARRLDFVLHHHRSRTTDMVLDFVAPSRDARHWLLLVRERLERLALEAPIEEIALRADALEALDSRNLDLLCGERTPEEGRAAIVERLQARLGREAVRGIASCSEHRPERAWRYGEPGEKRNAVARAHRPLWLLPEPIPLEVREDLPWLDGALALEPEPERIESGWWDGRDVARDYYVARDGSGRRLWVFRELRTPGRWFLQGLFG